MSRDVSEDGIHAPLPDGLEVRDTGEPGHQVDPRRSHSELYDAAGSRQVPGLDPEVGAQKLANCAQDKLCVLQGRLDEDVQVLGRTRAGVKGDGVGSDDEV